MVFFRLTGEILRSFSQTVNVVKAGRSLGTSRKMVEPLKTANPNKKWKIDTTTPNPNSLGNATNKQCSCSLSYRTSPLQSETFPSKIRVSALSVSGTCGRMGALLAPALIEAQRNNTEDEKSVVSKKWWPDSCLFISWSYHELASGSNSG